jgi:hypothetical protein
MRLIPSAVTLLALAGWAALSGCKESRTPGAADAAVPPHDTGAVAAVDSAVAAARTATARVDQLCGSQAAAARIVAAVAADSARQADSLRALADSVRADSIRLASADPPAGDTAAAAAPTRHRAPAKHAPTRTKRRAAAHGSATPVPVSWHGPVARRALGQAPLPGSLLPGCRVVAYYGNPLSKRMGILGEIPRDSMLARLARQADAYARADSATPVIPALELIATVAQAGAGRDGMYRARMPDTLISKIISWADNKNYLVILDIQVGRSTVASELRPLIPYLLHPNVHLALDPEFDMPPGKAPGHVIGTTDAADVNLVIDTLAKLVTDHQLPPKMLIVHRFTRPMLTNHERIRLDPRVQVVIDMDGFGAPHLKRSSYRSYVNRFPVQFAGFKLFYKNDKPLLTPEQVLELVPVPLFIMYQ